MRILLLILFPILSHAQLFEGTITYSVTYEHHALPSPWSTTVYEDEIIFRINKSGDYERITKANGTEVSRELYRHKENMLYRGESERSFITAIPCTIAGTDSLLYIDRIGGEAEILGHPVKSLMYVTKNDSIVDLYAEDLRTDASLYKYHLYRSLDQKYGKSQGGIALWRIVKNKDYTKTIEATKIESGVFSPSSFMLPADKIVISICSPEEPASPENGYRFYELVGQKLRYPAEARRKHIEGKVFVEFVVTKDGKAIDFKVIKGEAGGLNEEAIRVMKEIDMRWKPAVLNGQKVPSLMVLPLSFKLG